MLYYIGQKNTQWNHQSWIGLLRVQTSTLLKDGGAALAENRTNREIVFSQMLRFEMILRFGNFNILYISFFTGKLSLDHQQRATEVQVSDT